MMMARILLSGILFSGCITVGARSNRSIEAQSTAMIEYHKVIIHEICFSAVKDKNLCSCLTRETTQNDRKFKEYIKVLNKLGPMSAGFHIGSKTKCSINNPVASNTPLSQREFSIIKDKADKKYFYTFEIELARSYENSNKDFMSAAEFYAKILISPTYFPNLRKFTYQKDWQRLKELKESALEEAKRKMLDVYRKT